MGYRIEVRDANLNRIGMIDTWIQLDLMIRYCQEGTWSLVLEDDVAQTQLLQPGGGIGVYQDGVSVPVFSGQIESFQHQWSNDGQTGYGKLVVTGKCDNKLAYNRLALPDPTQAPDKQWNTTNDTRAVSGPASQLVWNELNSALGPGATAGRQIPNLVVPAMPTTGPTITDNLSWDVIGTKLESWINNSTTGYRFVWDANQKKIVLSVFAPRDLSKSVRFSNDLGNLQAYVWTETAPTVTRVIVACQGTGNSRYMYQQIDTDSEAEWGLSIEQFVDRRDLPLKADPVTGQPIKADPTVTDAAYTSALQAVKDAATQALFAGAKNGQFQITPIDTPQLKFGRDYYVGDIVTVNVNGVDYSDVISECLISVADGGKTVSVTPGVGIQTNGIPVNIYRIVSKMRAQLRKLEASF
jgi:hypothetical protein